MRRVSEVVTILVRQAERGVPADLVAAIVEKFAARQVATAPGTGAVFELIARTEDPHVLDGPQELRRILRFLNETCERLGYPHSVWRTVDADDIAGLSLE